LEARGIPGDYIEVGVWRGGAIIFMRALIEALQIPNRKIFAADSFFGIALSDNFRFDLVDGNAWWVKQQHHDPERNLG
jgi:O-methyltransferase